MKKLFLSFSALLMLTIFSGCSISSEKENIPEQVVSHVNEKIKTSLGDMNAEKKDSQLKKLVMQEQQNTEQKNVELSLRALDTKNSNTEKVTVEVVLKNPHQQEIQSIQAWFTYPISVLKGEKITLVHKDIFPIVAPNEQKFDAKNGIVQLGFSAEGKAKKTEKEIVLAQIEFSQISDAPFQLELFSGHTQVMSLTKNGLRNILK